MAPSRAKSLAEQLADLDDPAPKDFDPEEDLPEPESGEEEEGDDVDENAGREHYAAVGKSKLRKRDVVPLGPRYEGSKISRGEVEDDDEDDPFSRGFDEESSEDDEADNLVMDGASDAKEEEDDNSEEDAELDSEESPVRGDPSEGEDEDEDEDDDDHDSRNDDAQVDRAELRKMMADEQKSVAATLSQAAKADAEKGRAVKTQRATFDSLLNTRVKLQKALIGTNTLTALSEDAEEDYPSDAFHAAETAAFNLWSSLNDLRETLESSRLGKKRKHSTFTQDTPISDLWSYMRAQEESSQPHRNLVLEKWSAKARGAAAIQPRNRLNTGAEQTIVDVLQEQLSGDRLIKRARTPRSCAPVQLARKIQESDSIYDDADFYGLLLQSLLEQRSADSVAASAGAVDVSFQMRREAKTKKNVDTKASKGRKLRYTVHEKLQNFMAPEDRSLWGERQTDELFGSLFGRKMGLAEDDEDEDMEGGAADEEEAGLMLFRN